MTTLQFWILNVAVLLLAPLFLAEIVFSRDVREDQRKIVLLEQIAGQGAGYTNLYNQLAVRIYQLSGKDTALKEVLDVNNISVAPKTPPIPPVLPSQESHSPAPPSSMGPIPPSSEAP